jgi:CheY-like chemotaxis protein
MRPLVILHIEDRPEDLLLLSRTCETASLPVEIHPARDGVEAVAYLEGTGDFADRTSYPFPDLIVLDLKMPGMSGFAFLHWLRSIPKFKKLPVLVFTQSNDLSNKDRALAEGADGYFVKPIDEQSLARFSESLKPPQDSRKNRETPT